ELETKTDLSVERARLRGELIAAEHPRFAGREGELPARIEAELDERLDELVMEAEARRLQERVPEWAARWLESWSGLLLVDELALALRWAEGSADLELHVATAASR